MEVGYKWGFDSESDMFGITNPDGKLAWLHCEECPMGTKRHDAVDEVLTTICELLNGGKWPDDHTDPPASQE